MFEGVTLGPAGCTLILSVVLSAAAERTDANTQLEKGGRERASALFLRSPMSAVEMRERSLHSLIPVLVPVHTENHSTQCSTKGEMRSDRIARCQ